MQNIAEEIMRSAYCLPEKGQKILLNIAKDMAKDNSDRSPANILDSIKQEKQNYTL